MRSSAEYLLACEVYLVLALIKAFGVVGPRFFPQQALFTSFLVLSGIVLVGLAPKGGFVGARVGLLALATMAWYVTTVFWTPNRGAWRDFMLYLVVVPTIVMIMFNVIPFDRVMSTLRRLTYGVILLIFASAVAFPSLTTIHEKAGDDPALPGWHGMFIHKNEMVTFLVIGLITVLVFEPNRSLRRLTLGAVFLLAVLGQSGTGLGVLTLTLLCHGSIHRLQRYSGRRRELFLLGVIAAWTTLVAGLLVLGPTLVGLYGKDLTFTGRTQIWSATLTAIGERPFAGYGVGSVWVDFTTEPTASMERAIGFRASHAHNGALELWLETGLIGLVLWLSCFVAGVWSCWKVRRVAPDAARWGFLVCAAVAQFSVSETTTFRGPWIIVASLVVLMASAAARGKRDAETA